jgi:hypothetical protein
MRARKLLDLRANRRGERGGIRIHLPHDFGNDAVALFEERQQQVLRRDLRMPLAIGQLLGAEDGFLGFLCVLVDVHDDFFDAAQSRR